MSSHQNTGLTGQDQMGGGDNKIVLLMMKNGYGWIEMVIFTKVILALKKEKFMREVSHDL